MKVFYCKISANESHYGGFAVVAAFNRGHAVKLINKKLESEGKEPLSKDNKVEELDLEAKKAQVVLNWLEGI